MASFCGFLFIYILGGLTFLPLVLSLGLLYAYLTLPTHSTQKERADTKNALQRSNDDQYNLLTGTDVLVEKFRRAHESDVAAGYFAVCREYLPEGINGKLPDKKRPTAETGAAESPSVYQSMYRSIFDRKQSSTIEAANSIEKNVKRARNLFFIVLRYVYDVLVFCGGDN